ncbi:MAG: universal stress protein [Oscillochloris sp.]|nr:universal stress protein [Oscillochloris sp.]
MFQHILVPLDGSALSEQALLPAARLARASRAQLTLVHVHDAASPDPILVEDLPVIDADMHSLAAQHQRTYLERIAAGLRSDELRIATERLEGPIAPTLRNYAHERHVDLIVLTSHGRSGFARFWLGSVAERVIRCAGVPVLMLRPDSRIAPFRTILAPLDGSECAAAILPAVKAVAAADHASVTLLHIHEQQGEPFDLNPIAQDLRYSGLQVDLRIEQQSETVPAILAAATDGNADLLAFAVTGAQRSDAGTLGHIADKLLRGATMPVLVM